MSTTTDVPVEVADVETPTLQVADRCDQCQAQAFVVTQHKAGVLLWCGHHAAALPPVVQAQIVVDNRASINTRPSPSASTV